MTDRVVEFPNRYRMVRVNGTDDIVDLIPAPGDVTKEGTFLNKATLLSDMTARIFGLDETAVPNDALKIAGKHLHGKNLLKNWYFANPVNQRGGYVVPPGTIYYAATDTGMSNPVGQTSEYNPVVELYANYVIFTANNGATRLLASRSDIISGYTGVGYTIDRWINRGASDGAVLIESDCITLKATSVNGLILDQKSELFDEIKNAERTLSVAVKSVTGTWYLNAGGQFQPLSAGTNALTVSSVGGDDWVFRIYNATANASISLTAAKLEFGNTQTLAHQDESGNWVLNDPPPDKALETALSSRTVGMVQTGSYVGTGTYGPNNPNSITFDFLPKYLIFTAMTNNQVTSQLVEEHYGNHYYWFSPPVRFATPNFTSYLGPCGGGSPNHAYGKIDGTTFFWYYDYQEIEEAVSPTNAQLNSANTTYHWLAIG